MAGMFLKRKSCVGGSPPVSIGMPVYNGGKYLREALDSILAQTFDDFELIISDNGSTDQTELICRAYTARDARIRYYREEENRGVSWNFNRVFELSRGKYFKWAASDDICDSTFISRCVEVLDKDPSVVCCHSKTGKIDKYGNVLKNLPDPTDGGLVLAGGVARTKPIPNASSYVPHRRFHDVLMSIGWSVRSYGLIRAEALRRTCLIRPYYGYEKVMFAELSLLGRCYDIPEVLFYQRIHADASSNLITAKDQQKYFAPKLAGRRNYYRLQLLNGHMKAVWKFPLSLHDRIGCCIWIVRYVFQVRKWKEIISSIWHGTGAGGSDRKALQLMMQKEQAGYAKTNFTFQQHSMGSKRR